MKNFIYLDQDSINSYLAQMKKGLLVTCSNEKQSSESTSQTKDLTAVINGEIEFKIFGISDLNLNGDIEKNNSLTISDENIKSRIEEKILHDYSFEMVKDFLEDKKLIKTTNFNTGDIILEENEITMIDFEYFKNIFGNDGIIRNYQKVISLNNDKNKKNIINNEINAIKALNEMIEMIEKLIPYKRFGICSNYLILFDDKNFRDNPNILAFKYGGKMKFMGNVTNVICESNNQDNSNLNKFRNFHKQINQGAFKMFLNTDKIYIIHAIALYYETSEMEYDERN